ncbi:MAG: hypothetical protein GXO19_00860 [Epsilonproteobacteria bacterium]|nr:hypothetical protein [Campylobacterota bacterium]NPA56263.1 hypothetical protein [Campylobacterota bacterium]
MLAEIKRELRHLYGAGILFFYYMKYPILIGLPILYNFYDYPRNIYLDILWLWSAGLVIKDGVVLFLRWKRGEKLWR